MVSWHEFENYGGYEVLPWNPSNIIVLLILCLRLLLLLVLYRSESVSKGKNGMDNQGQNGYSHTKYYNMVSYPDSLVVAPCFHSFIALVFCPYHFRQSWVGHHLASCLLVPFCVLGGVACDWFRSVGHDHRRSRLPCSFASPYLNKKS